VVAREPLRGRLPLLLDLEFFLLIAMKKTERELDFQCYRRVKGKS
jgi:hypothetical protein